MRVRCFPNQLSLLVIVLVNVALASLRHHSGLSSLADRHRHHHHLYSHHRLGVGHPRASLRSDITLWGDFVHNTTFTTPKFFNSSHPPISLRSGFTLSRDFISRNFRSLVEFGLTGSVNEVISWPVKKEALLEGDVILGGLMMVHEREDTVTCGPIMPEGGIQALETMMYTLDVINREGWLPFRLGAHILDDCDKDTYGLEMAVDFIKGNFYVV